MSNKRGPWLTRRGQADVAAAIDQVIDQQPRPGEQVQEVLDELIEDSPYQARQSLDEASLEDLAQGMREVGFQGVLIIRPHGDPAQQRRGYFHSSTVIVVAQHGDASAQNGVNVVWCRSSCVRSRMNGC
jgi:hypothetical protein